MEKVDESDMLGMDIHAVGQGVDPIAALDDGIDILSRAKGTDRHGAAYSDYARISGGSGAERRSSIDFSKIPPVKRTLGERTVSTALRLRRQGFRSSIIISVVYCSSRTHIR